MHVQATAFLQKQNAGGRKLLAQGSDSELGMDGVRCSPFFIPETVRLLEYNLPVDSDENDSPKKVRRGFRANICIFFLEHLRSIGLAESGRSKDTCKN